MFTAKVFRHVLIPSAALIAEKAKSTSNDCCCRASELPIYSYDPPPPPVQTSHLDEEPSAIEKQFQETFGVARRKIFYVLGTIRGIEEKGENYLSDGITTVMCYVQCLQEDDSTTPKYGAIAIGALTGFILGLRGRFFKKTLYTSIGALAMAALCYPKEANEYSLIIFEEAKRYMTIGYNFMYGVKKGDPPLQLPSLPSLPSSLSDVWESAKGIATPKSSVSLTVTDSETTPPTTANVKADEPKKKT